MTVLPEERVLRGVAGDTNDNVFTFWRDTAYTLPFPCESYSWTMTVGTVTLTPGNGLTVNGNTVSWAMTPAQTPAAGVQPFAVSFTDASVNPPAHRTPVRGSIEFE